MRHNRLLFALLALVCLTRIALGQAEEQPPPTQPEGGAQAADETEADTAYRKLHEQFTLLQSSLRNKGGITEADHPAIRRMLERVEAFAQRRPDHVRAVAMQIQLATWLGEDQPHIAALYQRLMDLRPDDVNIALLWIREQEKTGELDSDGVVELYRHVQQRFPDDSTICAAYADRLRGELRYAEALDVLEQAELEPAKAPGAAYALADCLFVEHRFAEALAALESIPDSAVRDFQLRRTIDRDKPYFAEYVELWDREQQLRQAEEQADDLPRVAIETSRGRIVVELFENEAPNTVANFISLAESRFYDQTKFHRVIPNFMAQGGDPNTRPGATAPPGAGGPGYFIPDELNPETARKHFTGSLSMANSGAPNSAGSQFFITHEPAYGHNGSYTVFGRVLEGVEIVRRIEKDDVLQSAKVLRKRDHVYAPSTLPDPTSPILIPSRPAESTPPESVREDE